MTLRFVLSSLLLVCLSRTIQGGGLVLLDPVAPEPDKIVVTEPPAPPPHEPPPAPKESTSEPTAPNSDPAGSTEEKPDLTEEKETTAIDKIINYLIRKLKRRFGNAGWLVKALGSDGQPDWFRRIFADVKAMDLKHPKGHVLSDHQLLKYFHHYLGSGGIKDMKAANGDYTVFLEKVKGHLNILQRKHDDKEEYEDDDEEEDYHEDEEDEEDEEDYYEGAEEDEDEDEREGYKEMSERRPRKHHHHCQHILKKLAYLQMKLKQVQAQAKMCKQRKFPKQKSRKPMNKNFNRGKGRGRGNKKGHQRGHWQRRG